MTKWEIVSQVLMAGGPIGAVGTAMVEAARRACRS